MADNANGGEGRKPVELLAESFCLRVPKRQVQFGIELPPGRHYYRRAPLRFDELLEIALSTPGSVVRISAAPPRSPKPPGKSGDGGERRVVNRHLQVVHELPDNAAVLIYAPTGNCPSDE